MKTKKFHLNWPSVVLGMVLCLALTVLLGLAARMEAQTAGGMQRSDAQTGLAQKMANTNDVLARMNAMDERLARIEKAVDECRKEVWVVGENVKKKMK
jgi:TolA-binding protein